MIYFVQPVDGGPIKIGSSNNVPARIAQLERNYGRKLAVLGTMPGGRKQEAAIHARFSRYRLGRTEQFQPVREILDFIGRPLLVSANPETVELMEDSSKPVAFQVRSSPEYKAILEELAEFDGKSIASLADHAIRLYARTIGFPKPLPKR